MKRINKILGIGAICGLVMLTGCEGKNTEFLENPKGTETFTIKRGDMYWKYAGNVMSDCEMLRGLDKREVVHFIKYNLNNGKELYEGESVELPLYDCKEE